MRIRYLLLLLLPCVVGAQGLDLSSIGLFKHPADSWPTYNGDYSGRRFSELDQINQSSLDLLKIQWIYRIKGIGPQRGRCLTRLRRSPAFLAEGWQESSPPSRITGQVHENPPVA